MEAGTDERRRLLRMERLLAMLLRYGALVACILIALGMMLAGNSAAASDRFLAVGIVLLIALPVLRVALTTAVFLFERDYTFAIISAAVLLIIAVGFALGVARPHVHF